MKWWGPNSDEVADNVVLNVYMYFVLSIFFMQWLGGVGGIIVNITCAITLIKKCLVAPLPPPPNTHTNRRGLRKILSYMHI